MPARSGDCTSVRNRASRSAGSAVARGRAGAGAPRAEGQVVHLGAYVIGGQGRSRQGTAAAGAAGRVVVVSDSARSAPSSARRRPCGGRGSGSGLAPPLVSIEHVREQQPGVDLHRRDVRHVDRSLPACRSSRGVYCTTLVGVISTCVGNRRLPRSGGWRGTRRPARTAGPCARPTTISTSAIASDRGERPRRPRRIRRSATSMLSYFRQSQVRCQGDRSCRTARPARPGARRQQFLSGKPIRYYRPKGSPEIRHLIDEGFQAFNAGRLSEACADLLREDAGARATTRPSA